MDGGKEALGEKCLRRKQQGARWERGIREKCLRRKQQGAQWKRGIRGKVFEKEATRCKVEKRH